MSERPPPFTPADADLTAFPDMPLEVVRFAKSDLVAFAPAEAVLAGLLLWGSSWHSRPAGSLTNDDRALAQAAGYGRSVAAWLAVKDDALRGWTECSDGRLYHPVVAEKVNKAWITRLKQQHRTYAAAIRQHNSRNPDDQRETPAFEDWLECGRPQAVRREQKPPQQLDLIGMSRVTDGNVTRDSDECHANNGAMFAEKTLQGKGREGKGRDIRESTTPESRAENVEEEDEPDLMGITNRLARLGGVSIINPSAIARAMDVVKAWIADGLNIETEVVPIIEQAVLDAPPGGVASLGYFDRPIRTALARKAGSKRKPTKADKPLPPWDQKDDDDPGVRAFRKEAGVMIGQRAADHWLSPERCVVTLNGSAIVLKVRDGFHRNWIEQNVVDQLKRIAHLAGRERIKVEVAP
jgi:hypothetical protein